MTFVIGFAIAVGAFYVGKRIRHRLMLSSISKMPEEQLLVLFKYPSNRNLYLAALRELDVREHDISFALPLFLEMTQTKSFATNRLGLSGLNLFFPTEVSKVESYPLNLQQVNVK